MDNPATPRASLRASIDGKCRDCGAADGGAHWRMHVAACPVITCPLWAVRPLPKPAPHWLTRRTADALPTGWSRKPTEAAIATIKATGDRATVLPGEATDLDDLTAPDGNAPAASPRRGQFGARQ